MFEEIAIYKIISMKAGFPFFLLLFLLLPALDPLLLPSAVAQSLLPDHQSFISEMCVQVNNSALIENGIAPWDCADPFLGESLCANLSNPFLQCSQSIDGNLSIKHFRHSPLSSLPPFHLL